MGKGKVTSDVFGGRKSLDTTWRTPEWILERVRALFRGPIPFDPSTAVDNPTRALRYCAGPPGTLFAEASSLRCDRCAEKPPVLLPADDLEQECPGCWLMRQNGLEVSWLVHGPFFVNPPFGKLWTLKIADEVERGAKGIALLPANRFEESWLHRVLTRASTSCYVDGTPFQQGLKSKKRVAFISSKDGLPIDKNPFATMILGFGFMPDEWCEAMEPLGPCYASARISRKIQEVAETPPGRKLDVGAATDVVVRGFTEEAIANAERAWRENPEEMQAQRERINDAQPKLRPWPDVETAVSRDR